MPDDLTDAKIAASEARTDAKFARLDGKIDLLQQSIATLGNNVNVQRTEASANRNALLATIIGTGLALAALIAAMLSYGASPFYNGTVVRDVVRAEVAEHATQPNKP